MKEYLTVAEIEKQTGISNASIRRYLREFEAFFTPKGGSRIKKYEDGAVKVLQRIKILYDEGLDTHEIHGILTNEFPMMIDGEEPVKKEKIAEVPTLATSEDIAEIKEMMKLLVKKLDERDEAIRQRDEYIKQSLERRDRELMKAIRESQQKKIAAVNEVMVKNNEEGIMAAGEEVATAKETVDEVVMGNEEVTNDDEELTVTNGEEAVKASEEGITSNEELMNGDEEAMMNTGEEFPPRQEKQPKKKGFFSRLFGR